MSAVTMITGGTGKLGRILVADCLARGEKVVAISSKKETLSVLLSAHANAIDEGRLVAFACDLTARDASVAVTQFCEKNALMPTALVNNARSQAFLKISETGIVGREDFVGELTLDVVVPYELSMGLAYMDASVLRRVINIGSQYGIVAPNRYLYDDFDRQSPAHYGVSKAALIHLSRELAVRLAPRNIQVNCISFGGVEGRADPMFQARYAKLAPAGRMMSEDEVAGPVAFLLSDASAGMTGHNLVVDGGWTAW